MDEFISVEEARRRIMTFHRVLGSERVSLMQAMGRVIAEDIVAPTDTPRFAHASRDGYAFRFEDLSGAADGLAIVGVSAAGVPSEREVGPGEAARITTGAELPAGADTVVMQEYCSVDEAASRLTLEDADAVEPGQWVRQVGEDMAAGELIIERGTRLGAAEIGLLAGFGRSMVTVTLKPRVAIVSTGDELVDPGTPPGPAQIVNSNAYMLAALVQEYGGVPQILPIARDDEDTIRRAFTEAIARADLVLSSGGVSVGDFDFTRPVLDELTEGMKFWKVRIKPGKPLAFGIARDGSIETPVLGLPGNPNACFVGFHQFVRRVLGELDLDSMQSELDPSERLPSIQAILNDPVKTTPRRRVYLSGHLQDTDNGRPGSKPLFYPVLNQNSGNLRLFCQATAFGIVEEGVSELKKGDIIRVERI